MLSLIPLATRRTTKGSSEFAKQFFFNTKTLESPNSSNRLYNHPLRFPASMHTTRQQVPRCITSSSTTTTTRAATIGLLTTEPKHNYSPTHTISRDTKILRHFTSSTSSPLPKSGAPTSAEPPPKPSTKTSVIANDAFTYSPRGPVRFEDFLEADTNHDGRVTSAEWDAYLKRMREVDNDPRFTGLMVHLPISVLDAQRILESSGLSVSLNGLNYSVTLTPQGKTIDLIKKKELELMKIDEELETLAAKKAPLDAQAAVHTRRVMGGLLAYLVTQAAVIAKMTIDIGWDFTEPITYFITFSISLVGLIFFTWNRIEFSYPALAAAVARRKAGKLYVVNGFDVNRYLELQRRRSQIQQQLDALIPPKISFK